MIRELTAARTRAARLRVLLVEDSPDYAHLVTLALDAMEVRHAASLAEARAALGEAAWDVVVADLHLPDAEGAGLIAELTAAAGPVPVLALSGSRQDALVAAALRAGAAGFAAKGGETDGTLDEAIRSTAARRPVPDPPARALELSGAAVAAGVVAAVVGILIGLAWAAGLELREVDGGCAVVVPGTAGALLAAGVAVVWLAQDRRPVARRVLAAVCAALGLAILAGVALGLEPGADRGGDPLHAAPPGAVALVLLGAGLLLTGRLPRAHLFAIPPALIVVAGGLGALYGRGAHATPTQTLGTALVTVGLAALVLGLLLLHPGRGIGAVMASDTDAGHLGRRLVPVALVVPPALGALRLLAFEAGLVGEAMSIALLASALVVSAMLVIALATRASIRLEVRRAAAEQALRASEDRFRGLAALAPVGIIEIEPAAGATFVNARFCELAGLAPEDARGAGWQAAVHPEDRDRLAAAWDQLVAAGGRTALEVRWLRPDGTTTWTQLSAVPMRPGADGRPAGVLGVVTDIQPFKAAAALLERERSMLRALLDHAPLAIELRDADGHIQLVNEEAAAALGRPPAAILGRHPCELLPADRCAERAAREAPVLRDGRAVAYEDAAPGPGGATRHRHVTTYPVRSADGSLLGVGAIALDVTERVEAAAALGAAEERFRGAFAAAPTPMAVTDAAGLIEEANDALAQLLGRPRALLAGVDLAAYLQPVGEATVGEALAELMHGGTGTLAGEALIPGPTGLLRVAARAVALTDGAGRPAGLLWHLRTAGDPWDPGDGTRGRATPGAALLDRRELTGVLRRHARRERHRPRGAVLLVDVAAAGGPGDAAAGGAVARLAEEVVRLRLSAGEPLARLDDGVLAVLLADASPEDARRLAGTLGAALREAGARQGLGLAVRTGVAAADGTADDVIAAAGRALRAALPPGRLRAA